jgi:hypothetical protein
MAALLGCVSVGFGVWFLAARPPEYIVEVDAKVTTCHKTVRLQAAFLDGEVEVNLVDVQKVGGFADLQDPSAIG